MDTERPLVPTWSSVLGIARVLALLTVGRLQIWMCERNFCTQIFARIRANQGHPAPYVVHRMLPDKKDPLPRD